MIKELCLFSGYGGSVFALTKAGVQHKCIGYSDIEDCANYIFPLNHGEDIPQLGDITKINPDVLEDFDLCTFGFPCQSFSIAGKREGLAAVNKGKLFFEVIRILETKKPRYALGENVQGILSHDNGKTFKIVLSELKRIGYHVNWKLLFSKEHGTPQNRPRVWFACFREKEDFDKFMFPEKEELKITVKDLLEEEVDEKYYLTQNQLSKIIDANQRENYNFYKSPEDINKPFSTLKTHMGVDNSDVPYFQVADFRYDEGLRVRKDNVCPTLASSQTISESVSNMPIINYVQEKANREQKPQQLGSKEFIAINKQLNQHTKSWRRLTPRECFRLQGFFNDEIKFGNLSDSKLYFLAGNGWDINVASKIFKQMFFGNQNKQQGLGDFNV